MARKPGDAVSRARQLRRDETETERLLWKHLRGRRLGGAKFRRQVPIGPYFADFCCLEAKLIIELDGDQHAERRAYDRRRSEFLERSGYRVLRFWNRELRELDASYCRSPELCAVESPLPPGEG